MKTSITSHQFNLTEDQIRESINNHTEVDLTKIEKLSVWAVSKKFTGYGHWKLSVQLDCGSYKDILIITTGTSDSVLIDNWDADGSIAVALEHVIRANEWEVMEHFENQSE